MHIGTLSIRVAAVALVASYFAAPVSAVPVFIHGNPKIDDLLLDSPDVDYTSIGDRSFGLRSSFGIARSSLATGFKFGRGHKHQPDEQFVNLLNPHTSIGTRHFGHVFNRDGGLNHIQLYGVEGGTQVPEPGTLGLLGAGIFGLAMLRRFKKKA